MWVVGDELLGTGGLYGFGYDPFSGYAFGVTNQGTRDSSFYSPTLFDHAGDSESRLPDMTDRDYVAWVFRNNYGREATTEELNYWLGRLASLGRANLASAMSTPVQNVAVTGSTENNQPGPTQQSQSASWLLPAVIVIAAIVLSK